jgi:glyoxylase-like metal-dependent hydrolase (beta-lactamase superfamily II)
MNATAPEYGVMRTIAPGIRRLIAPNPGPMTYWGTNTYLLGEKEITIVDPGPNDPAHMDNILRAIGKAQVAQIIVTHSHLDHSPLAHPLAQRVSAPVLAYGPSYAGQSALMRSFAQRFDLGGSEGVDINFVPDQTLTHNQTISIDGQPARILWTPGHMSNHICLELGNVLLSGDHVMGWASTLISPPDGDLTAFRKSCRRLLDSPCQSFAPGHGEVIKNPQERITWLLAHRQNREDQIRSILSQSPVTAAQLTQQIYSDVSPELWPAAQRSVLAHLLDLYAQGHAKATAPLTINSTFHAV